MLKVAQVPVVEGNDDTIRIERIRSAQQLRGAGERLDPEVALEIPEMGAEARTKRLTGEIEIAASPA